MIGDGRQAAFGAADTAHVPGAAWTVRRLEVADVRPYERLALDLPGGLVVLFGENGAGKTSLIEAIALACLGVSPRTSRETEAIRRGAEALHVAIDLEGPAGPTRREIGYAPRIGRRLRIDGEPVRSLREWRVPEAVLVFLPEELRAVKGPPAARRRHLDRLLEASVPGYADDLAEYGIALSQRNALLRRVRAGVTGSAGLAPWESRMAATGASIVSARRAATDKLAPRFADWLERLGGGEGGCLALEPSPRVLVDIDDAGLEEALLKDLHDRREQDLRAAQTLAGPHRDDVWIGVGHPADHAAADLRRTGSQGEQRTAVLALVLSHRDHLAAAALSPVLLLDDALSELDPERRRRVLEATASPGQTLITTADPDAARAAEERGARVFHVAAAQVRVGAPDGGA